MTKIVHLCLACFYIDGFSYQENLLPKWHKKLGYDVEIIASPQTFDSDGRLSEKSPGPKTYINEDGIRVTRLDYRFRSPFLKKLNLFVDLSEKLEGACPDILFIHGLQFYDMSRVVRYLKLHPAVRVFVDNHADYSNSARNWVSKTIAHRVLWRHTAKIIEPYTTKFWGVLPARVDFLLENYKLPPSKCDLLVMGADDDEVSRALLPEVRLATRSELGITDEDFLVVTGGKIDSAKWQTLLLMNAVSSLHSCGYSIRLLVFGPVDPDLKDVFMNHVDDDVIKYVKWANVSKSYDYFAAADTICFPGRHSVYWEQAVAMGKPLIVKWWEGTAHVNVCGNVTFLYNDSSDEISNVLKRYLEDDSFIRSACEAAQIAAPSFMYSSISKRSIEIANDVKDTV